MVCVRACVYMYVHTHTRTLHPRHGDTPPGSCYSIRLMQVMSGGGVTSGLQVASPGRKAPVTFLTLSAQGQPRDLLGAHSGASLELVYAWMWL